MPLHLYDTCKPQVVFISYDLRFAQPPPQVGLISLSGSQNSGKYLKHLLVYYKENYTGYGWRDAQGEVWEKGHGVSMTSLGVHPPGTSMCSTSWKLSEHCPSGFLWKLNFTGMTANRLVGETQHYFLPGKGQNLCGMRRIYDLLSDKDRSEDFL